MLLDLVEVLKLHIGANLAIVFAEVLEAFRIKEKVRITIESKENWYSHAAQILSVTADNASNNDTMISKLGGILEEFPGAANQTCCFAYIISISAKAILR